MDVMHIVESGSLLIICLIVFAETGLLIGFFLPGDTLLLTAGVFASQGKLELIPTIIAIIISSILGNITGYHIGKHSGKRLFKKEEGILFRQEYTDKAEEFYKTHGNKTILLARFVPIVRTFAAVVAGIGRMSYEQFMLYNIIGGILWGGGVTMLGYYLGTKIPGLDHYINLVLAVVVVLTFAISLWHIFKEPEARDQLRQKLRSVFQRTK